MPKLPTASPSAPAATARSGDRLFALWAWGIGLPYTLVCGALVTALPGVERRRSMARASARGLLRIAGMPLTVEGLEHLPPGGCIVVANHASYLDGAVLTAALPPDFAFVIKREAQRIPLVGLMLRRLRSHFVDRDDRRAGSADAGRMIKLAQRGHPIGIFPEGTFIAEPGLRPFRRGAFITACRAGLPVVPVAIRGTRHALGPQGWLPRRGPLEVEVLPALAPTGRTLEAAAALAAAARASILARCGEPDRGAG